MFCKNCGKELDEGAMFCSSCGTAVSAEAAGQNAEAGFRPDAGAKSGGNSRPEDVRQSEGTGGLIIGGFALGCVSGFFGIGSLFFDNDFFYFMGIAAGIVGAIISVVAKPRGNDSLKLFNTLGRRLGILGCVVAILSFIINMAVYYS